ncbi:hypothetical protein CBFG_03193 [Clostridiales bacterium 1_7_47FAA]|nr:hypothetical protein CBFG_03193 [Clostridiales bacterium 1_7_47FAA]
MHCRAIPFLAFFCAIFCAFVRDSANLETIIKKIIFSTQFYHILILKLFGKYAYK